MNNAAWLVVLLGCGGTTPAPQPPAQVPVTQPPVTPPAPPGLSKDVCAQRADVLGPVPLQPDQVALRRGTGAKTFADLATTREAPIEVCMPDGERAWLGSVTCVDGTNPSASGRSGSVGPGGTCGSIIDLYTVTCPEKAYEVFMDMYMCPPGQGM